MAESAGEIYYIVDARTANLLQAEKEIDSSINRTERSMQRGEQANKSYSQSLDRAGKQGKTASTSLNSVGDGGKRAASGMNTASSAALKLNPLLAAVSAALSVNKLVKWSDEWTNIQNRLRPVTTSTQQLADVTNDLLKVSNANGASFADNADLYARLARSNENLKASQQDLIRFTDLVNKSFVDNGTSAAGQAGAITQLSQAFSSGILQGEEFNTMLDQAPLLLQAMQKETGLNTAELKKLGSQGSLSVNTLFKAVLNYSDAIDGRAAQAQKTWSQSIQVAENNMVAFMGSTDSARGAIGATGKALVSLSSNMDLVSDAAASMAAIIAGRYITSWGAAATAQLAAAAAAIKTAQAERDLSRQAIEATRAAQAKAALQTQVIRSTIAEAEADATLVAQEAAVTTSYTRRLALEKQLTEIKATHAQATLRLAAAEKEEAAIAAQATTANAANAAALSRMSTVAAGATAVMRGLRGVMALMGGPAGVFLLVAMAAYEFRDSLTESGRAAQRAKAKYAGLTDELYELSNAQLAVKRAEILSNLIEAETRADNARKAIKKLNDTSSADKSTPYSPYAGVIGRVTEKLSGTNIYAGNGENKALTDATADVNEVQRQWDRFNKEVANLKRQRNFERTVPTIDLPKPSMGSSGGRSGRGRSPTTSTPQQEIDLLNQALDLQKQYNDLVGNQRSEEEKSLDTLKERLNLLGRAQVAGIGSDYEGQRQRALNDTLGGLHSGRQNYQGGEYDNQFQRYDNDASNEDSRYKTQQDTLQKALDQQLITEQEYYSRSAAAAQDHADNIQQIENARQSLLLSTTSNMFSNLADATRTFAGENSGLYKAMFAASKAFAIADAAVKIQQGIASAAVLPFPANIPAMASVAASTASILSTISSTNMGGGRINGGSVSAGTMYPVTEDGKPEMYSDGTRNYLLPGKNGSVTSNKDMQGSGAAQVSVNVHNNGSPVNATSKVSQQGNYITVDMFLSDMANDKEMSQSIQKYHGTRRRGS